MASNMVAHMSQLCKEHSMPTLPLPDVLVLEAPFNNLMDEIESHPFSKVIPLIQILIIKVQRISTGK